VVGNPETTGPYWRDKERRLAIEMAKAGISASRSQWEFRREWSPTSPGWEIEYQPQVKHLGLARKPKTKK
jgi:hypothetical protein